MDTEAVVALVAAIAAALVTGVADYFIRKGDRAAQAAGRREELEAEAEARRRERDEAERGRWRDTAATAVARAQDTLDQADPIQLTATFPFRADDESRQNEAIRLLQGVTETGRKPSDSFERSL